MSSWPPPAAPDPDRPGSRGISRRALVLGSLGAATASGIAVIYASRSSGGATSAPPSSIVTTPATTPATTTTPPPPPTTTSPPTTPTTTPATTTPTATAPSTDDRVLVVLQLGGGNDALNTLVPLTGAYHDARPVIGLDDSTLVALPGTTAYGLHPSLAPLGPILAAGNLGIAAGIGFEHPNRSHFASLDMWWAGSPDGTTGPGWLGRWLDATAGPDDALLRAVGLGGNVPALRADVSTSVAIAEIEQFSLTSAGESDALAAAWASLTPAHAAAGAATQQIADLAALLPPTADTDGDVTRRLRIAAALIATEPDARVIHVAVSGFDTHASQLDTHAALLADVARGIAEFQTAITASGNATRTMLVTTSEFGRRIEDNGSAGTDHGKAGVQLVVSAGVRALDSGVVFGTLDPADPIDGDLRPVIDPRSLYATALDWLGGGLAAELTDQVLGGGFERLPFVIPTRG